MNKELVGSVVCTAVAGTSTAIQPDQVFAYIQMGLTILATLITIILGLRAWWKDVTKDGKIDKEEVDEAVKIVEDGVKTIIDSTKKEEKK